MALSAFATLGPERVEERRAGAGEPVQLHPRQMRLPPRASKTSIMSSGEETWAPPIPPIPTRPPGPPDEGPLVRTPPPTLTSRPLRTAISRSAWAGRSTTTYRSHRSICARIVCRAALSSGKTSSRTSGLAHEAVAPVVAEGNVAGQGELRGGAGLRRGEEGEEDTGDASGERDTHEGAHGQSSWRRSSTRRPYSRQGSATRRRAPRTGRMRRR